MRETVLGRVPCYTGASTPLTSEGACRARAALRGSAAREDAPGGGTSGRNVRFQHERTFTRVGAADAEAKAGRF